MSQIQWSPGVTLENVEKQVILAAYRHFRGNKTATANSLGIAIRTLDNKLKSYEDQQEAMAKQEQSEDAKRAAELQRRRGFNTNPDGSIVVFGKEPAAGPKPHIDSSDHGYAANLASIREQREQRERVTARRAFEKAREAAGSKDANHDEAERGLPVQSASVATKEHAVSLPIGAEVQGMPSGSATKSGSGSSR